MVQQHLKISSSSKTSQCSIAQLQPASSQDQRNNLRCAPQFRSPVNRGLLLQVRARKARELNVPGRRSFSPDSSSWSSHDPAAGGCNVHFTDRTSRTCVTGAPPCADRGHEHGQKAERLEGDSRYSGATGYSYSRSVTGVLLARLGSQTILLAPFSVALSSFASEHADFPLPLSHSLD